MQLAYTGQSGVDDGLSGVVVRIGPTSSVASCQSINVSVKVTFSSRSSLSRNVGHVLSGVCLIIIKR